MSDGVRVIQYGVDVQEDIRQEQYVKYLQGQVYPYPEQDGVLEIFLNAGDRQWMYDEAVENNYALPDVDRWFHLLDVMGIDFNFETAMKIDKALYEADLETMELPLPEERKSFEEKLGAAIQNSNVKEMDLGKLSRDELRAMRDQIDGVLAQKERDLPLSTTIYFTTTEGPDATQFDTQDMAELMELFHMLLEENGLKLVSIDGIETVVDQDRVREAAGVAMNEKLSERSNSMDGGKVSEEQVVAYLKRWGHPHPEEDGTLDEFMNGDELQWMYDEAVRNDYDFPDMDRWICLVNALGAEISFDAAMAIEGALYEEDLDSHEFERAEDFLHTPRGVCGDMLRASLGMDNVWRLPADVRLVTGEKDLEALRGVFGALLERKFENVLSEAKRSCASQGFGIRVAEKGTRDCMSQ